MAGLVTKKPRQSLRKVGKKLQPKRARYVAWIAEAMKSVDRCGKCGSAHSGLEPHHPYGRSNDNLFKVVAICHACHEWIHANPNEAMDSGWLQPEIRGLKPSAEKPPFTLLQ